MPAFFLYFLLPGDIGNNIDHHNQSSSIEETRRTMTQRETQWS